MPGIAGVPKSANHALALWYISCGSLSVRLYWTRPIFPDDASERMRYIDVVSWAGKFVYSMLQFCWLSPADLIAGRPIRAE